VQFIIKCSAVDDDDDDWTNRNIYIKWNKTTLVEQYNYLGVIITNDGKNRQINNRIKKANRIYYEINNTVLGKKEVDLRTKIQIYKSCIFQP
jgi:hypothetical protein